MTYTAPSVDYYDDGLVHSHDWSRSSPPGSHHAAGRRASNQGSGQKHDHDEGQGHEQRRAHQ